MAPLVRTGGSRHTGLAAPPHRNIHPCLRGQFVDDELKILCETKKRKLIDANNHPDKKISDHLPIVFEIMED